MGRTAEAEREAFTREVEGVQLLLPLSRPPADIAGGVWMASLWAVRRRRHRRGRPEPVKQEQLALKLRVVYMSRGSRRPCSYPFEMVEYARKLRGFEFTYKEISAELQHKFKRPVPWITVRDWVNSYYRMRR
ncbi:hypothetical protein [Solimonas marina]|uniref:Uncharacterized protein n=1 Tax=Solimonas marina TaxID=2714601 RepID=A0A970B5H2_9GAMM|nr:hypothetical protein [Solimonas marina]NKF21560.1 hypothetical protein [Solimonas marina]